MRVSYGLERRNGMRELHHFDIFTLPNNKAEENIVCVTTNGIIKRDGTAVMGAGIAKTANLRFKVAEKLADSLRTNGNVVSDLRIYSLSNNLQSSLLLLSIQMVFNTFF